MTVIRLWAYWIMRSVWWKKEQYYKTHGPQYLYSISKRQAAIQTECCLLIPDESSNITHLMAHVKNLISALSDLLPSLGGLLRSWFHSGSSCTNLYCGPINVISCITYILYKVVVSCITQCVTRFSRKLMMAQHLETTDHIYIFLYKGFPGGSVVKNLPAMQEMRVWSLS